MSEPNVSYEPNKVRSRPLRCILLPIVAIFLFILYWFALCPLLYVALRRMKLGWTHYWPYYFWITAFIVFLIILGLLVLLWRKKCKNCPRDVKVPVADGSSETKELLKVDPAEDALRSEELDKNIKALEKKLDGDIDKVNLNTDEIKVYTDKDQIETAPPPDVPPTKGELSGFVRNDLQKVEPELSTSSQPPSNLDKVTEETKVELHSPAYPLTPREIFFWDLIQSANKNDSVKFNFKESDKDIESGDDSITSKELIPSEEGSVPEEVPVEYISSSNLPIEAHHDEPRRADEVEPLITKDSPPLSISDATLRMRRSVPAVHHSHETEYFIANVSERKSLASEVYLYVDGGKDEKYYRIRMDNDNQDCV